MMPRFPSKPCREPDSIQSFRLANQVPLVNVAGMVAILLSVIPVYIASRITSDAGGVTGARG